MNYLFKGRLSGLICPECPEALSGVLVRLYRQMVLTRLFDQKAVALQRTGRIGTYAPTLGQEAIGVAIGALMQAEDVLVPYYRDTAVQLMRGVKMEEILLYWGGDERGSAFADPAVAEDFPLCVPIATQALHACGVASAFKIRGEHRVAVTTCGDGATSKGDFLEALNVAGAWQLPVVFVVNNNQWAISVPRRIQCGAPTLAQKAIGAGSLVIRNSAAPSPMLMPWRPLSNGWQRVPLRDSRLSKPLIVKPHRLSAPPTITASTSPAASIR